MESTRRFAELLAPSQNLRAGVTTGAGLARLRSVPRLVSMVRDALLRAATPGAVPPESPPESRLDGARRLFASTVLIGKDVAQQARNRLNAPLVGPTRFATRTEYRVWKACRAARPQAWNPLQWPLRIWLVIGLVGMLWVRSLLS